LSNSQSAVLADRHPDEAVAERPSITPLRVTLFVGAMTTLFAFALDMYLPALPSLTDDFDTSASLGQLTLTGVLAGLAVGQLLVGPLADSRGRLPPLFCGLVLYIGASIACVFAPSIHWLIAFRFAQGLGASAGVVVGRAIVSDLYRGTEAARIFSRLMLVVGVSPILAPVLGSLLLRFTDWQGVFVTLAVVGIALMLACVRGLPETHPSSRRSQGGISAATQAFAKLVRDRRFTSYMVVSGLSTGTIIAYIAGTPFVIQNVYGESPQLFAFLFALNALGLVGASQISARLVATTGSVALVRRGTIGMAVSGVALLAAVCVPGLGVWSVVVPCFCMLSSQGFAGPNSLALAMAQHPDLAGRASAMIGVFQFSVGGVIAPLIGIAGEDTALPLGIVIATVTTVSAVQLAVFTREPR
jgi:DHA1 family bicyclomycin/chloramphenicol resistance-like MFS transporter